MNWNNEEQYEDHTAARAMVRVMTRDPDELDTLEDAGSLQLIAPVQPQTVRLLLRPAETARPRRRPAAEGT